METVRCNLCGSDRYKLVYQKPDLAFFPNEVFSVVECTQCGLGFVNPRPTEAETPKYYPEAYYACDIQWQDTAARAKRAARYLRHASGTGRRILDVGCGNGGFLKYVNNLGWDAEGLEIGSNARPITDFPIYRVPFPELENAEGRYDVVTLWAVLEHVHDPMSYLVKAYSVLKDGGHLFINCPNFGSMASKTLFGEDIPRHLYFFTEKTLVQYFQKTGFELISSHRGSDVYSLDPHNLLIYLIHKYLLRRPFDASSLKKTRWGYFREKGLSPGLLSTVNYCLHHPLGALDTALARLVGLAEQVLGSYGNATYVAKKRNE